MRRCWIWTTCSWKSNTAELEETSCEEMNQMPMEDIKQIHSWTAHKVLWVKKAIGAGTEVHQKITLTKPKHQVTVSNMHREWRKTLGHLDRKQIHCYAYLAPAYSNQRTAEIWTTLTAETRLTITKLPESWKIKEDTSLAEEWRENIRQRSLAAARV